MADEPPIDLEKQIADEITAVQLVIAALNPASLNPQVQLTLVNAQATLGHLQLLQAHMQAAHIVVKVSPTDPNFLTLSTIGKRLDAQIKNGALVSSALEDLQLVLSTANQGFQIVQSLAN